LGSRRVPAAAGQPPVAVYLSLLAWRDDEGRHLAITAGRVHRAPAAVLRPPDLPVPRVGARWQQRRVQRRLPRPRQVARPAGREIPYDVARYVALDTLSAVGGMAGFSLGGPPGMAAGFLAMAIARGVVSGTVGLIRARAASRWTVRQHSAPPTRGGSAPRTGEQRPPARRRQEQSLSRGNGRSDAGRRARDERRRTTEGPARGR
jgi:hypothetical protein